MYKFFQIQMNSLARKDVIYKTVTIHNFLYTSFSKLGSIPVVSWRRAHQIAVALNPCSAPLLLAKFGAIFLDYLSFNYDF